MLLNLYKYYIESTKRLIFLFIAYSVIQVVLILDGSYTSTAIINSLIITVLYTLFNKNNRHLLSSLPVSREKMFFADYLALLSILVLSNIIIVTIYSALGTMLTNPNLNTPLNIILGISFLAIANSLVLKCSYDYFARLGTKGKIITTSIVAFAFVIVTFFIIAISDVFKSTADIFFYGLGIVILLIIFLVTKSYCQRLDL